MISFVCRCVGFFIILMLRVGFFLELILFAFKRSNVIWNYWRGGRRGSLLIALFLWGLLCCASWWLLYAWSLTIFNFLTGLYCCDRAEDYACQTACKRILMSMKTELEIVDGLIEGCKTMPLPQDPLWQCFLESSRSVHPGVTVHPPPSTGLDGAKLHCCSKANSSTCRSVSLYPHFQLWKYFRICLVSGFCPNLAMYIK